MALFLPPWLQPLAPPSAVQAHASGGDELFLLAIGLMLVVLVLRGIGRSRKVNGHRKGGR